MDFNGRTALVTGANRGIGRAIAEELARRPLGLLLCGVRSPDRFEAIEPMPGGAKEVRAVRLDLSSPEEIGQAWEGLPDLDLLVNNAGLLTADQLERQELDEIYAMLQVNLLATIDLTRRALPGMLARGSGKIVNNASISAYAWFPGASTYAASKAGVVAFSESLRRELRDTGVTVLHLVTPGVDTDMLAATKESYERLGTDPASWDQVPAPEWAGRVVKAIEEDESVLGPGGRSALAKLASRGPGFLLDAVSERMFSRRSGEGGSAPP
jgi:short-subunit dehydrogenase